MKMAVTFSFALRSVPRDGVEMYLELINDLSMAVKAVKDSAPTVDKHNATVLMQVLFADHQKSFEMVLDWVETTKNESISNMARSRFGFAGVDIHKESVTEEEKAVTRCTLVDRGLLNLHLHTDEDRKKLMLPEDVAAAADSILGLFAEMEKLMVREQQRRDAEGVKDLEPDQPPATVKEKAPAKRKTPNEATKQAKQKKTVAKEPITIETSESDEEPIEDLDAAPVAIPKKKRKAVAEPENQSDSDDSEDIFTEAVRETEMNTLKELNAQHRHAEGKPN